MTELYIVSGFLGAGKTTLIQAALKVCFQNRRVVLIENDFGEVNVDAELLSGKGIQVRAISSGCICCTLAGDFVRSLQEVLQTYHPEVIVIEPSGVGKLSDVVRACADPHVAALTTLCGQMTVVDVHQCHKQLENFGAFFRDQVQAATALYLSRAEQFPQETQKSREMLQKLNAHAVYFTSPPTASSVQSLFSQNRSSLLPKRQGSQENPKSEMPHAHAHDVFASLTLRYQGDLKQRRLQRAFRRLEKEPVQCGVLRAKGILRCGDAYLEVQYLPRELRLTQTEAAGRYLCFIGSHLQEEAIQSLFAEENLL